MKFLKRKSPREADPMLTLDTPGLAPITAADDKKRRKDGGLSAYAAFDNLVQSTEGLWAFFVLDEAAWLFKHDEERAMLMGQFSQSLYEIGDRIWWRGTTNPFPSSDWARALDLSTQGRRIAASTADTFDGYQQTTDGRAFTARVARVQDCIGRHGTRKRLHVLGVRISPRKVVRTKADLALIAGTEPLAGKHGQLEEYRQKARRLNSIIVGNPDGFHDPEGDTTPPISGQKMTDKGMGWLWHASIGMGMSVPVGYLAGHEDGWDDDELEGFTNTVTPSIAPFGRSVELRSSRLVESVEVGDDGEPVLVASMEEVVKHVAVAHVRVVRDRSAREVQTGALLPWLHFVTTLPFDTDFVMCGDILSADSLEKDAERTAGVAIDLTEHQAEHGLRTDKRQTDAVESALAYEESVRTADAEVGARFRGVVMVAVTGESEKDVYENKMGPLVSRARRAARLELTVQKAQYASYRSFWPGEPVILKGSPIQMSLPVLAASMPNVDTGLGDRTGVVLGPIAGSRDVAIFDLHGGPRRDGSGMVFCAGQQGSGKSKLNGIFAEFSVNGLGVPAILNDPSGPADQLALVPWLTRHTRVLDLASNAAKAGIVTPSVLVPEPKREHYDTDDDWKAACRTGTRERREMLRDVLTMLLPNAMIDGPDGGMIRSIMFEAVTDAAGEYGQSPWEVVAALERIAARGGNEASLARTIAKTLRNESDQLGGRQVFPDPMANQAGESGIEALTSNLLTIIKLSGIKIPAAGTPRSAWDTQEQASQPLLYLSSRFATRAMYADKSRITILNDEMALLGGSDSVASLAARTSADSRKWNALAVYATQNPITLFDMAPQITNLAGAMFMGRMKSEEAATAALQLMGAPLDQGLQQTLMSMARGNFLMRDWEGRIGHMLVDLAFISDELNEATNTTPKVDNEYDYDPAFQGVNAT